MLLRKQRVYRVLLWEEESSHKSLSTIRRSIFYITNCCSLLQNLEEESKNVKLTRASRNKSCTRLQILKWDKLWHWHFKTLSLSHPVCFVSFKSSPLLFEPCIFLEIEWQKNQYVNIWYLHLYCIELVDNGPDGPRHIGGQQWCMWLVLVLWLIKDVRGRIVTLHDHLTN
jgi:hypothetical protein